MTSLYQGQFDPQNPKTYKISRSKVELFINCKRCFYLDRRLKIPRPPGFPFNLNSAVDNLLKNEFDIYRNLQKPHPLQEEHKIDAIPFQHENLDNWRNNFKGVFSLHKETNFHLFGAVDDLWVDSKKRLMVVDYKATSKSEPIRALDKGWQDSYKRQMEFYQWLLRRNEFEVSDTGYFVYCNGKRNEERFDCRLDFEISVIPHKGKDSWVEKVLFEMRECLMGGKTPNPRKDCEYCNYLASAGKV